MSTNDASEKPKLDKVIGEYLQAEQSGTASDRDDLLQQHPDLADDLSSFFANHDQAKAFAEVPTVDTPIAAYDTTQAFNHRDDDATPKAEGSFGDYEILGEIARGGMGVVYKARQTKLNRTVALKMIRSAHLASDYDVQRFYTEAEAAATLDHPGIVPVYEVGERDGQHFFSMGYVEGSTLAGKITDGPLPAKVAAEYTLTIAEAVAYAHDRGVIHRDLKPGNVLLTESDEPRVTDFGLAKLTQRDGELTATGQIMGTPGYMPPEQAAGKIREVTETADVYSLGAILYTLLTSRPPFQGESHLETLRQVMEYDPVAPRVLNPSVPVDLETICLRCLEKDRPNRYESARELVDELRRFLSGEAIQARPINALERTWRWCKRKPVVASLSGVVAALLLILAVAGPIVAINQRQLAAQKTKLAEEATTAQSKAEKKADEARRNLYIAHMQQIEHEWNRNDLDRVTGLLDAYRSGERAGLRDWEWYYWDRMCNLDVRTLVANEPVNCVAYSPDGSLIASCSGSSVAVWEVGTGQQRHFLNAQDGVIKCLAFHKSGELLAYGCSDANIGLWDPVTGAKYLMQHQSAVTSVTFSPDGEWLAAGTLRGGIRIWRVSTREIAANFQSNQGGRVSFCPDSLHLICAGEPQIEVWNIVDKRRTHVCPGHRTSLDSNVGYHTMTAAVLSPDGETLVTSSGDGRVKLWDRFSGQELETLEGHNSEAVNLVAFSADGKRLASASADNTIKLWDLATAKETRTLKGHRDKVEWVTFSPDGLKIASASADGTVKIWDSNLKSDVRPMFTPTGHYWRTGFSPGGKFVALSGYFGGPGRPKAVSVEVRDAKNWKRLFRDEDARKFNFGPKGRRIATCTEDNVIRIWDLPTGSAIGTLSGISGRISYFDVSGVGDYVLTVSGDRQQAELAVWDISTGARLYMYSGVGIGARVSPVDTVFASVESVRGHSERNNEPSGLLRIVEPFTGETIWSCQVGKVGPLRISPSGQFVAAIMDRKTVGVWRISDGTRVLDETLSGAWKCSFSKDERFVAAGSREGPVVCWNLATGSEQIRLPKGGLRNMVFNPTCTRLLTVTDSDALNIWHTETGDLMCRIPIHPKIWRWICSPDANQVLFSNPTATMLLDINPSTPKSMAVREAQMLSTHLLAGVWAMRDFPAPRRPEEIEAQVKTMAVSEDVRKIVLEVVKEYGPREQALWFSGASWELALRPDRTSEEYRQALDWAEVANGVAPDSWADAIDVHGALGLARYRNGQYRESLEPLKRAVKISASFEGMITPGELAMMAMAYFRMGEKDLAQSTLERAKAFRRSATDSKLLVREAEVVIAGDRDRPSDQ